MGTRHLIMVKQNKDFKVAQYGQWDGYPDGQGETVLKFLSDKDNISRLKKSLSKIRFVDSKGRDKDFVESFNANAPEYTNSPDNRTQEQIDWFNNYIDRDLGAKILFNIINSKDKEILLKNNIDFLKDGLFCEWAYNLDLDNNILEVYDSGKLIKKYSFDSLPTTKEMVKDCMPNEE